MADEMNSQEAQGSSPGNNTSTASNNSLLEPLDIQEMYGEIHTCIQAIFNRDSSTSHPELRKVLLEVIDLVNHDKLPRQYCYKPDSYTHTSITSQVLASYLSLLDERQLKRLSACIKSDCTHWLAKLFGYENGSASFHDNRWEGLARVCRLALLLKYPKYGTEGFTALYTRPPVIYVSTAAAQGLGQYLCSQLGLPKSSICKVPCNTVFGSRHTIDISAFERLFHDDVSCGKTPLLLIAYAGTPLAGHTDNLGRLRELCTQHGLWLHLEGDTLAALALHSVPPSLKTATSSDSMTLDISKWFSLPGVPFTTVFQSKDPVLAEASGLTRPQSPERLSVLPLWTSIQNIGLEKMRQLILDAAQLAQQMCISVDSVTSVKRLTQPHCTSLTVVFRYRASPSSTSSSATSSHEGSGADDDQDESDLSTQSSEGGELPQHIQDAMNKRLADQLAAAEHCVVMDLVDIPKEGCCLRFNPIASARVAGTTSDHIDNFVACLKEQVANMDNFLLAQIAVKSSLVGKEHVVITETEDSSAVASLLCFPQYWQSKTTESLSEAKKMELNNLNKEVLQKLTESHPDTFSQGITTKGLTIINFNKVALASEVNTLIDVVCQTAEELADSSKFLEQMTEIIQKGIEEAQKDLAKESEHKLLEEGVLRQVPIVSSLVNWWSPPPKETMQGRTFNLSSGHLDTTEKTYKYHMQVQDENSADGSFIESTPSTPTTKTPPTNTPKNNPSPASSTS